MWKPVSAVSLVHASANVAKRDYERSPLVTRLLKRAWTNWSVTKAWPLEDSASRGTKSEVSCGGKRAKMSFTSCAVNMPAGRWVALQTRLPTCTVQEQCCELERFGGVGVYSARESVRGWIALIGGERASGGRTPGLNNVVAHGRVRADIQPIPPTATMSQFRAAKLDIGCFAKIRNIRDHTKRKVYSENEPERHAPLHLTLPWRND